MARERGRKERGRPFRGPSRPRSLEIKGKLDRGFWSARLVGEGVVREEGIPSNGRPPCFLEQRRTPIR